VALRPFLSELGCLSVSKQVIISNAAGALSEAGEPLGEHAASIAKLTDTMLSQLQWWASATIAQRTKA